MAILFIVATPIGNLKDISQRAIEILKEADLILCEDTRVTKKLLDAYNIQNKLESYHQHSNLKKIAYIRQLLQEGKKLALVSDSGTPGISDPGNKLIEQVADIAQIIPIPGSSALTAIASAAGFPMDKFLFLGFPPHKTKRKKFFEEIAASKHPVIIYESPHRILKALNDLENAGEFKIVVGKELTKQFETIYRGRPKEVAKEISKEARGEFVIAINKLG